MSNPCFAPLKTQLGHSDRFWKIEQNGWNQPLETSPMPSGALYSTFFGKGSPLNSTNQKRMPGHWASVKVFFAGHLPGHALRGPATRADLRRRERALGVALWAAGGDHAELYAHGGVTCFRLDCYWVGSLDFNCLGNQGVNTKATKPFGDSPFSSPSWPVLAATESPWRGLLATNGWPFPFGCGSNPFWDG